MSKVAELAYDIQELYIEGLGAKRIAQQLDIPMEEVLTVIESFGCLDNDQFDPFDTVNS
jgi:orotate phosphoribosyltransferase-like protein